MSESHPHLTPSYSYGGTLSATNVESRPLQKRRLTTTADLAFFTPAAQSFKPRPYTPNGASTAIKPPPALARTSSSLVNLAQPIPVMDPAPSDPCAVFIHPPFTNFPNAHLHPEGLSYGLMSANPEWFLDAADFVSSTPEHDSRDVISYPPQLEPPRGWCPAKKKDLKALGADGWPEGSEPRLRCTFCRRTYAGVNAKSMWRRHVYEKHKIAMANRREGNNDRSRSRSFNKHIKHNSNKENNSDDGGCSSVKLSSMSPQNHYVPLQPPNHYYQAQEEFIVPSAPYIEQKEFPVPTMSVDFSQEQAVLNAVPSISPPLTPPSISPKLSRRSLSEPASPSPRQVQTMVPPSPYNPLLTPAFRHSPPRLPSDQPWRFPSPSHPLHSRAREVCLSTLVRGSPSVKGLDSSPASMLRTPGVVRNAGGAAESGKMDPLDTSPALMRSSPLVLFGQSPFPSILDRNELGSYRSRVDESPLGRLMFRKHHNRQKSSLSTFSEIGHDWFSSDGPSSSQLIENSGLLTPTRLPREDLFAGMYSSWVKEPKSESGKGRTPSLASPGGESPILRSSQLSGSSQLVGLGIGLMAPFAFPNHTYSASPEDEDVDFNLTFPPSPSPDDERDEAEVEGSLTAFRSIAPPKFAMRRVHSHMTGLDGNAQNEQDVFEMLAPPMKRRRTVDTRD